MTTFADAQHEIDSKIVTGLKGSIYAAKLNAVLTAMLAACEETVTSRAPLVSPAFEDVPTAPTADPGTETTQIATTEFVTLGLAGKQPLDATLTALAAVTVAANKLIYATGPDAFTTATLTAKGREVIAAADAAALTALINGATLSTAGLLPAPGSAVGKFLRDDLTWADAPGAGGGGTGDVVGPASSVDSEVVLFSGTGGKTLKRASAISGLLKLASGVASAAVSGTDYAPATSGTAILKGNGTGGFTSATAGTHYAPATSGTAILKGNGAGGFASAAAGTDYAPATSGTGVLKGNGSGGTTAAVAGTDFAAVSHNHAASAITSGTIATARLGSGSANSGSFLRGDQTWAAVPAGVTSVVVGDTSGSTGAITSIAASISGGVLTINVTTRAGGGGGEPGGGG